jgi:hypothetical protein
MTDTKLGLSKILFPLNPSDWHGSARETLWAKSLGGGLYELRNVPFYAFDVSYEDVVEAENVAGVLTFKRLSSRSGHSTYRILIEEAASGKFEAFWAPIAEHGCTYEAGHPPLRAIDVPPSADVRAVHELLQRGEDAGVWSFEEGHVGHRLTSQ